MQLDHCLCTVMSTCCVYVYNIVCCRILENNWVCALSRLDSQTTFDVILLPLAGEDCFTIIVVALWEN